MLDNTTVVSQSVTDVQAEDLGHRSVEITGFGRVRSTADCERMQSVIRASNFPTSRERQAAIRRDQLSDDQRKLKLARVDRMDAEMALDGCPLRISRHSKYAKSVLQMAQVTNNARRAFVRER